MLLHKGTEHPGVGEYEHENCTGLYVCRRCDLPLYLSSSKFHSACGWPSFDEALQGNIRQAPDPDGVRIELLCQRCGGHLGHLFYGEGFTKKNRRHCVNSISLRFISAYTQEGYERAVFAGGCFWGVEHLLKNSITPAEAICSIRVGYTGGSFVNPTYEEVCSGQTGHYEAVELLFDPKKISYETIAKTFFEIHDPTQAGHQGPDWGAQYDSAVFYFSLVQKKIAEHLIARLESMGLQIATKVLPGTIFYPAEEYHQGYYQKHNKKPYCHHLTKRFED